MQTMQKNMPKPLKALLASALSSLLLFTAQQSMADTFPPNFNVQPPSWAAGQTPIAWGDCIPVPVTAVPFPQGAMPNMTMSAPSQPPALMPFPAPMPPIGNQANILPPPSPFFNNVPVAPIPLPIPPIEATCDNSSQDELQALQKKYTQAATASRAKIEEVTQALNDANNQMADARIIIDNLSKEKNTNQENGAKALAELKNHLMLLDNTNKSLQEKLSSYEANAGEQAKKLTLLGQSSTELAELKNAYKEQNNAMAALKKQLNDLDNANKTLKTQLVTANNNAEAQARKLTALGQSATELAALKSAYKARNDETVTLKKQLADLDNANKTLQAQLASANNSASAQARKLTAFGQSTTELTALKSAYKARNDENAQLKKKLSDINTKLSSLTTAATLKSTQDNNTIAALKKKLADYDNTNKSLKTQLASAEAGAGAQARKLTALGQSATELTALKSAYKARNDENAELKVKLKASQEFANSCKFEVADLKKKLFESGNETKSLLGKIATLEKTVSDQARKVTALTATSIELSSLKSAYKDLSSKEDELKSKLNAATADTDKDGVLDSADKCPFTLAGTEVDALGCLADSDNDGVANSKDNCPDSPANSVVNAEGCPKIEDADGDKVADANDLCPATPAGTSVNEFGCAPTENITLRGVNFTTGSARLTSSSLPILAAAAETLKKNTNLKIEIAGYTDNQGAGFINRRLSQRRANSVMIELIKNGVDADMLTAKGYGEKNPIASNKTEKGRATNRRVELIIQK